jgi:acetylornithine/succinyldiaminopimelate/putrescine aminotransferase
VIRLLPSLAIAKTDIDLFLNRLQDAIAQQQIKTP